MDGVQGAGSGLDEGQQVVRERGARVVGEGGEVEDVAVGLDAEARRGAGGGGGEGQQAHGGFSWIRRWWR